MFIQKNFLLLVIGLSVVFAVAMKATVYQKDPVPPAPPVPAESAAFRAYWTTGKAELNQYTLQQARYGTIHSENAVLIFAPERFRTDTQVRVDSSANADKAIPVLRTTIIQQATSGVDDYELSTSVFTPINQPAFPGTLKVTSSLQDWDGARYRQLNLRNNGFQVVSHSCVEDEADAEYRVEKTMFEDELYARIRLNPAKLPTGDVRLIPGMASTWLRHKRTEPQSATVTLTSMAGQGWLNTATGPPVTDSVQAYTVDYTKDARKLMIVFEKAFPNRILGWEETYSDAGKRLTSKAILTKTVRTDHANQHYPADTTRRNELLP